MPSRNDAQNGRIGLDDPSCRWCGSKGLKAPTRVAGYDFVECLACGFVFCPAITAETSGELYRAAPAVGEGEGRVPEGGWRHAGVIEPVLALHGASARLRLLDFGCGESSLPEEIRRLGHQVIAVDMSEPLIPHPDRLTGNLLDLALAGEQFDICYSFQVFEHLPEPRPLFDELLRLTRPGGHVFIHTDMETEERGAGFENWWYVLPPQHCCFYRLQSFRKILSGTAHTLAGEGPKHIIVRKG